jgi:hypothetical protein
VAVINSADDLVAEARSLKSCFRRFVLRPELAADLRHKQTAPCMQSPDSKSQELTRSYSAQTPAKASERLLLGAKVTSLAAFGFQNSLANAAEIAPSAPARAPSLIQRLEGSERDVIIWLVIAVIFFLVGWLSGSMHARRRERSRRTKLRF